MVTRRDEKWAFAGSCSAVVDRVPRSRVVRTSVVAALDKHTAFAFAKVVVADLEQTRILV